MVLFYFDQFYDTFSDINSRSSSQNLFAHSLKVMIFWLEIVEIEFHLFIIYLKES